MLEGIREISFVCVMMTLKPSFCAYFFPKLRMETGMLTVFLNFTSVGINLLPFLIIKSTSDLEMVL